MIQILSDIPVPPDYRGRKAKYPFADLKVGQMFWIPGEEAPMGGIRTLLSAVGAYRRRTGAIQHRFVVRPHEDGIGVWRVA